MTAFITKNEYANLSQEERVAYKDFLIDYFADNPSEVELAHTVWFS